MPRKTLDPGAQPFEFKVGVGIAHLGGMYRLGDPSMCPPHRFRYLQNVRLGGKDIRDRFGMREAADTGSGHAVKGITELPPARAPISVWLGPQAKIMANLTHEISEVYTYQSLDNTWRQPPIDWTPPLWEDRYRGTTQHIPAATYIYPNGVPDPYFKLQPTGFGLAAPVGRLPFLEANSSQISKTLFGTYHFVAGARLPDEIINWSIRKEFEPGQDSDEVFMTERIAPVCADVIVRFNDMWLAAGNYRGDQNPSAMGTPKALSSTLDNNAGQPIYEVTFDIDGNYNPWEGLPSLATKPKYQVVRPGGFREVCRMPGKVTEIIPDRAAGGAPGTLIRSMRVWSERQDDPLTGEVQTGSVLYIGTNGGWPLVPGIPPNDWPHATQDNGEVYSFDGTSVKLEAGTGLGIGQMVMVEVLPDGGVIAVGRTGGAFRNPNTGTWAAVNVSPTYFQQGFRLNPAFVSQDYGFLWVDRIVFQGEAYFLGFDVRRMGQEPRSGMWIGPEMWGLPVPIPIYDHPDTGLVSPVPIPGSSAPEELQLPRAWVLYKYARSTNTLILVRSGDDIAAALGLFNNPVQLSPRWGPQAYNALLATDGYHLFYTHDWIDTMDAPDHNFHGIKFGAFDGTIFEDNFIPDPGFNWPLYAQSMIGHEDGVFVLFEGDLWQFSYSTKTLDQVWEGTIAGRAGLPFSQGGRRGLSMDQTLFFGPK